MEKKVICQNSSQTALTPAIIWELFAKKSADRPNWSKVAGTYNHVYLNLDLFWFQTLENAHFCYVWQQLINFVTFSNPKLITMIWKWCLHPICSLELWIYSLFILLFFDPCGLDSNWTFFNISVDCLKKLALFYLGNGFLKVQKDGCTKNWKYPF